MHFSDASMWHNRSQLRQQYALTDRSYFRWIEDLSRFGLHRSLPVAQDKKIRLFYWPDIEHAVSKAIADSGSSTLIARGCKKKLFLTTATPGTPLAPARSTTSAGACQPPPHDR